MFQRRKRLRGRLCLCSRETGGTWIEQQKLTASDAHAFSNFGHAVALSGDGNIALIGADTGTGSGYIFVRRRNRWSQLQELTVSSAGSSANFGWSVALSADGKTALIGAINVSCPTGENACGAAYVFTRGKNDSWIEQQKLTASDAAQDDEFGSSVALSTDGTIALIGVFFADCSTGNNCGAAYVFARASSGAWLEQQKLTASDEAASAEFGSSIRSPPTAKPLLSERQTLSVPRELRSAVRLMYLWPRKIHGWNSRSSRSRPT